MNAVEIEEAVSTLADQPFDPAEFPFAFLRAFGNKETTIKRLRSGASNKSDLGGVLQTNNIHIAVSPPGEVAKALAALKASPATARAKARFILATDGTDLKAEDLEAGDTVACAYRDFPDHFGSFLHLAGITTVKQVRESSFDIRATSRLNRLYIELLRDNAAWGTAERRPDMNHFMARLIFCFFAEDTGIFNEKALFTNTVERMSARDSSNTHEVIGEIFRAMNTPIADRASAALPRWANTFPYVNGGLFSGSPEVPRFSKIARSYLLRIGGLEWTQINPDIFGSMIQAVTDDEERGALGMHYTSVPNILKVLNPLFLDDLRARLEEAGTNPRMLLNLRKRLARIRVFDPACGSGNFLVIAYKQMREIENTINERRGEPGRKSEIPKTNFRGIELRDFSAEIARLALIIAEFQCDVLYRGQKEALAEFLPLDKQNWITRGNALQMDWLSACPPTGTNVRLLGGDLLSAPLDQAEIEFENEGGETYICGNPPYRGSQWQTAEQKADLKSIFEGRTDNWKSLDYVAGWFMKAADYGTRTACVSAFVSTNSICQGRQVETLWQLIFSTGHAIAFAHTSFKWANLASHNAGVTVVIVGITNRPTRTRLLYSESGESGSTVKVAENINAYLVPGRNVTIAPSSSPLSDIGEMRFGNMPNDGGHLLLSLTEANAALTEHGVEPSFIRPFLGSQEFIRGIERRCLWVHDEDFAAARNNDWLSNRFDAVREQRSASDRRTTKALASVPYRFGEVRQTGDETVIIVPSVSSEAREYLPVGFCRPGTIISNLAFAIYDAPLWNLALIASRLHLVWIATVCGKLKADFRYSNTLGWNTFPVPTLTEKNRSDLSRCAEDILLIREVHFPATIADLYDPEGMPADLREAHERNDEVLERIYIGRRFRNDTERLEKLFELHTKIAAAVGPTRKRKAEAGL
ncbi:class I SAM-dependent DNA methyltransferase [Sinimarinibacterium flocculans]|uniref:site-specific DNA-methyltransferase (adenine-specific) n=1 Tax=Sinimarinibacterium flocculans TaxID=985250 RepID=A0A318E9A1_9GAMM|nr:DNA methyltransferase [Sinimarinibacterium flocculans]MEC9362936.1 DNA methyltransferase [Pseudomonadota bacterium]PXV66040.1 type II restriction/modification system DNA methylase subunit YeeA [Sinimarinibacterium flocculans]